MVIEKVHGLHATGISLDQRFTLLIDTPMDMHFTRPRWRSSGPYSHGQNINNRNLIHRIAQRLGQQSKIQAVKQRLGIPGLRRFGSESSLPGLQRSNSFSNLSQRTVRSRTSWRQSNGNLRSASFNNVSQDLWRNHGFIRRGGRMGLMRGRMRVRGGRQQIVGSLQGQTRGRGRGRGRVIRGQNTRGQSRGQVRQKGARGQFRRGAAQGQVGRGAPRGQTIRGRGRGRGGTVRTQQPVPTKEELDLQLDQYMASTKSALDKELDEYMNHAMETE